MRVETGEASEFCGADSYAAPAVDHSAASKIPLAYDDDVILSDGAFQSGLFHLNTLAENLHAFVGAKLRQSTAARSEEHTSELQSLMRISYAVFCLKKQKKTHIKHSAQGLNNQL